MSDIIIGQRPLGFIWPTLDPFLFCAHHDDDYPPGNAALGVEPEQLKGRDVGSDFELRDGWRMYHGDVVPGFPRHPHRGFETVTLARHGLIDHSDSLGAQARFGGGDVQWMTAGKGIVHAEMFPLLQRDQRNRGELFQLWLNLPRADKMKDPYFTMFWSEQIPRHVFRDGGGRSTTVTVIAGTLAHETADVKPLPPPPSSWASRPEAHVAIWTLALEPGARWMLPATAPGVQRMLYFFVGDTLHVSGRAVERGAAGQALQLQQEVTVRLENGSEPTELLLLAGRPLGEPVVQHGPFVMNTPGEIRQAMIDYHETGFGGWPWDRDDPVHAPERGRFARHIDGREEEPG